MTVLVDAAIWPWRGDRWAHLVSDHSLAELHRFANALGLRRVGFQGDHYDVDAATRDRAIDLGAVPTPGRELVRRLREAGLRDRSRHHRGWDRLGGHEALDRLDAPDLLADLTRTALLGSPLGRAGRSAASLVAAAELVGAVLADGPPELSLRVMLLGRDQVGALVVDDPHAAGLGALNGFDPGPGVTAVVGGDHDRRTIEVFLPAPPD